MQHDNSDDPWGFWPDEPTRQLKRTQVGTRAHGETRLIPVVRTDHADRTRPMAEPHHHNPLVARVGVMVGAMFLLVPVALGMRDDKPRVRAAEIQAVEPMVVGQLPPAPTEASTLPPAPTTIVATTATSATSVLTEAVVVTAAPTAPPTTAAKPKKKAVAKTTTPSSAPPAAATQSAAKVCSATYTVVKGDAWSTIATRAKVAMKDLLAVNNATIQSVLLPGKDICLPAGAVAPATPSTKPATTQPPATQPKATSPATTQPTTPPGTTVPATTQPAPPPNVYTKAQVAQIIRDVWPDDLEDEAIRIATRESNLIPTVRNSCCYGLFQIYYTAHSTWLASIGITSAAQLYDPRVNATAALALYNNNGWTPWATGTTVLV
jgi:LysM repeat protein